MNLQATIGCHILTLPYKHLRLLEENTLWRLPQKQKLVLQGCTLDPRHCSTKKMLRVNTKEEENCSHSIYRINLGNASVVLRSQTTLFASTFHALMPPSAVPMRSFCQKEPQNLKE